MASHENEDTKQPNSPESQVHNIQRRAISIDTEAHENHGADTDTHTKPSGLQSPRRHTLAVPRDCEDKGFSEPAKTENCLQKIEHMSHNSEHATLTQLMDLRQGKIGSSLPIPPLSTLTEIPTAPFPAYSPGRLSSPSRAKSLFLADSAKDKANSSHVSGEREKTEKKIYLAATCALAFESPLAAGLATKLISRWRKHRAERESRGCIMNPDSNKGTKWRFAVQNASKLGYGLAGSTAGSTPRLLDVSAWLEAVDRKHRYGHNLRPYHRYWLQSHAKDRFFHWLDHGEGQNVTLSEISREDLDSQRVEYCDAEARKKYELKQSVKEWNGQAYLYLEYAQTGVPVHTLNEQHHDSGKWIFVMSPQMVLYTNRKKKGKFHHSSFLSGGAAVMAGRISVDEGRLIGLEPHSGHYRPEIKNMLNLHKYWSEMGVDIKTINFGKPKNWEGPWLFGSEEGATDVDVNSPVKVLFDD